MSLRTVFLSLALNPLWNKIQAFPLGSHSSFISVVQKKQMPFTALVGDTPNSWPLRSLISCSTMIGSGMGYWPSVGQWESGLDVSLALAGKSYSLSPGISKPIGCIQEPTGNCICHPNPWSFQRGKWSQKRMGGAFLLTSLGHQIHTCQKQDFSISIKTATEIFLFPLSWFDFSFCHL